MQQLGNDLQRVRQDIDEARRQRHAIAERFEQVEGRLPNSKQAWDAERAMLTETFDTYEERLRDANAKFTKIGAPHSYVISGDKVHKLCAGALPLGILEECEPQEHNVKLEEGDLVILFSDGVAEAELNDNALYERITRSAKADNVKSIADRIIRETIISSGGAAKDDLTVIVSRVTAA